MVNQQLKVAWICHFSNEEVRKRLPLSKMYILNFLKTSFGKRRTEYFDFAPWVNNLIEEFKKFKDVEVHIISPHKGLKRIKTSFEIDGISYHMFKAELPFLLSTISNTLLKRQHKGYWLNRYIIKRYLHNIKPDIVNLIGAENPYYSIASLDIKNIPVYVSVQTIYSNPNRQELSGECNPSIWNLELKIHRKEIYFGCSGRMHRDLLLKNNKNAIVFKNFFPFQKPRKFKPVNIEFDFVLFTAVVTKKKGIEDALAALAIVKNTKRDVTLNVVGKCNVDYKKYLQTKIEALGLNENIFFNDYFPIHEEMHQHIKKSRFALLPNKLDIISGTVIEAMLLELPLITYQTTGTPYLNKNGEAVLLATIGDISKLAENMLKLLNSSKIAEKLSKDAKAFVEKEFDNTTSAKRLLSNYQAVIDHYHNSIPIPQELLFSTNEFPIY